MVAMPRATTIPINSSVAIIQPRRKKNTTTPVTAAAAANAAGSDVNLQDLPQIWIARLGSVLANRETII
jgi:hypothetical protein